MAEERMWRDGHEHLTSLKDIVSDWLFDADRPVES